MFRLLEHSRVLVFKSSVTTIHKEGIEGEKACSNGVLDERFVVRLGTDIIFIVLSRKPTDLNS